MIEYKKVERRRTAMNGRDDGTGIPEEDLPYLFERCYRVDKSRSKKTEGRGSGLSITKAIIEKHGGTIYAQNNEYQGCVFTFVLPNETFI